MMDPALIPRGACVDAKMLRCSASPYDPMSKDLNDDNTSSWPALAPSLDDENLLQEILLRLPLQPSSLLRASLVCTRWLSILSNSEFLKRYRKHHKKPPLLGIFTTSISTEYEFFPILNTKPNRIPLSASPCLYESASSVWGSIASTVTTAVILWNRPSILIANALFWLLCGGCVLPFDIERPSLDVIEKPLDAHGIDGFSFQLLRTNDSALGFAVLSKRSIQLWKRKSNCDGVFE